MTYLFACAFLAFLNMTLVFVTLVVTREINRLRDVITLGVMDGRSVSLEFRRMLLLNDWLPYSAGFELVLLATVILVLLPPILIDPWDVGLQVVCIVGAFPLAVSVLTQIFFTISEYKSLRQRLRDAAG